MYANSQGKPTQESQGILPIYRLDNERMGFLNVS